MMLGHDSWQPMHILNVSHLTPDVRAYRLIPVRNKPLRPFKAGQHIVIQCEIEGNWIERSYTLTSASGNLEYYEVAVKREDKGLLSGWLFKNDQTVPFLRVSHPGGLFTFNPAKPSALVCFTAGIGVTPAVCFARTIEQLNASRPLSIYITAHSQKHLPYDTELEVLSAKHSSIKYNKHLTDAKGRMQAEDILKIAQQDLSADFFICGPKGFETMVKTTLNSAGIPDKQIIIEQFTHAFQL
jgi:ferredoxin-NADP reductase